jgi:hypothetical protein
MSRLERWSILFTLILLACIPGAVALATSHPAGYSASGRQHPDSLTWEMLKELHQDAVMSKTTGQGIVLGSDEVPIPTTKGTDPWTLLQVTQVDDPFITNQCRRAAIANAERIIGGHDIAQQHLDEHLEEWKQVLRGDRRVSLAQYLDHIGNCKEFCAPLIGALLKCHIEGVGQTDSLIITFAVGVPRENEQFVLSSQEKEQIAAFVRNMSSKGKRILIEARASILNENENLIVNIKLSRRRAAVMKDALRESSFPEKNILVKSLCWEPPRLAIREVANAYGFGSARSHLRDPQRMDQSVVLLGY